MLCFQSSSVASGSEAKGVKPKHYVSEIKREKKIHPNQKEALVSSHTYELISGHQQVSKMLPSLCFFKEALD